jgi:alpha-1,2-mannosyltransferase
VRPVVAGLLFAALAYKPHFGLVVPVALLAAGHWRSFAAASVGVAVMTLATLVVFGTPPWLAFFAGAEFTRATILEQGALGFEKVQSVFAAVRLLGGSIGLAYALQAAMTGAALASVAWLWRCRVDGRLKAATLIVAALLATPYVLDYDMVALGPAIAFAISYGLEKGFGPYEKTGLALVWAAPLFARVLAGIGLPVGVVVMAGFLAGLVHRALRERVKQDGASEINLARRV